MYMPRSISQRAGLLTPTGFPCYSHSSSSSSSSSGGQLHHDDHHHHWVVSYTTMIIIIVIINLVAVVGSRPTLPHGAGGGYSGRGPPAGVPAFPSRAVWRGRRAPPAGAENGSFVHVYEPAHFLPDLEGEGIPPIPCAGKRHAPLKSGWHPPGNPRSLALASTSTDRIYATEGAAVLAH